MKYTVDNCSGIGVLSYTNEKSDGPYLSEGNCTGGYLKHDSIRWELSISYEQYDTLLDDALHCH